MYSALDIAKIVIYETNREKCKITNLKLQKLLYYIQAYFLLTKQEPCFDDKIVKWQLGPVVLNVYFEYSKHVNNPLYVDEADYYEAKKRISNDDFDKIIIINKQLACRTAAQLVTKSHKELPWTIANDSDIISVDSIQRYYRNVSQII